MEIKDVRQDVDAIGERVATIEEQEQAQDEEVEHLQQEVLRLQVQQKDIQAHAEDLEKRSRKNNIRIRGVPPKEEGPDITHYLQGLFRHILQESQDFDIKIDRVHTVGLQRKAPAPPPDILPFLPDFQLKEESNGRSTTDLSGTRNAHTTT